MAFFFLSYIAAAFFTLVSFLVMTRVLTPEHFGAFNVIILSATTAYFVVFAWVPHSVQRFHSAPEFKGRASAEALGAGAIVMALALPLFLLALGLVPQDWRLPMLLGAFFWVANGLNESGLAGLRVMGDGPRFAAAVVLRPVIGTALAVGLALAGFGYAGAVIGMSAGAAVTGAYVCLYSIRHFGIRMPGLSSLKAFMNFGVPLAFVASSSTIVVLITQSLLARGPGMAAVGIFAAAQTLTLRGITMPMSMLSSAIGATIFHAFEVEGEEATNRVLDRHFSFLMLVGLPCAGAMALSNDTVANLLFKAPFCDQVALYLPILAGAAFLIGVQGGFFDYPFLLARRTGLQLLLNATVIVAHGVLSVGLIWAFGTAGASWAFVFTGVFGLWLYRYLGRSLWSQNIPWAEIRKAAVAFVVFAPIAVAADRLDSPLLSPVVAVLAGVAYVIALALQRQAATMSALAGFGRSRLGRRATSGFRRLVRSS